MPWIKLRSPERRCYQRDFTDDELDSVLELEDDPYPYDPESHSCETCEKCTAEGYIDPECTKFWKRNQDSGARDGCPDHVLAREYVHNPKFQPA